MQNKRANEAKDSALFQAEDTNIESTFAPEHSIVLANRDCRDLLSQIPDGCVQMVVTSPPYNIGKEYEQKLDLDLYIDQQREIIRECVRILNPAGSICWQVGNYVSRGAIVPLDIALHPVFQELGLTMRNRIIWHFEHGLHCSKRFSGRHETIMWYTLSEDYYFDLDPVRVPQKYPGKKHFKGPRAGELSCNPKGKNPGDVWIIPNVKYNHIEKTDHPCQFPVELVERLILSLSGEGDWVVDPFAGAGTTLAAAIKHRRRAAGAEIETGYCAIAEARIRAAARGELRTRPMDRPVYTPPTPATSRETLW